MLLENYTTFSPNSKGEILKIALLEVSSLNHVCMIETWIRICHHNNWKIDVYTFTEFNSNISEELKKSDNVKIYHDGNVENIIKLVNNQKIKYDKFIFTTIQGYLLQTLKLRISSEVIIVVHNAKTWFDSTLLNYKLKGMIKHLIRCYWLKKANRIIVNSENMRTYIKGLKLNKEIEVLPFSINNQDVEENKVNNRLMIVYPGMISQLRKKYDNFLFLAQNFPEIDFVLLGAANQKEMGKEVLEKVKNMKLDNLAYFEEYVSKEKFDDYLKKSDFLFSEINVEYRNGEISEIYGKTKDSGVSYLSIEYKLPTLLNSNFRNLDILTGSTIYFSDYEDLKEKINIIRNDKSLIAKMKTSIDNSRKVHSIEHYAQIIKNWWIE